MSLKPDETIQKILISTTSRLVGGYDSDTLSIHIAWPQLGQKQIHMFNENPFTRNYYVVTIKTEKPTEECQFPNYSYLGDNICILLSILFGKRFDNNGLLQGRGVTHVPNIENNAIYLSKAGFNNYKPRADLGLDLNLKNFAILAPLMEYQDENFLNVLLTAGNFYLRAIRRFEEEPELSFLDLISCGEVLANFYNYSDEELLDEYLKVIRDNLVQFPNKNYYKITKNNLEILFKKKLNKEIINVLNYSIGKVFTEGDFNDELAKLNISEPQKMLILKYSKLPDGKEIWSRVRKRLYQVKKKYTLTIMNLLNDYFFNNTEVLNDELKHYSLKKEDIEKRIKYSYDVRSKFVHCGVPFGSRIYPHNMFMNEIQMGIFVANQNDSEEIKEFEKALHVSPTFIGLERIIRYCLLRFIHMNAVKIDDRLDNDGVPEVF